MKKIKDRNLVILTIIAAIALVSGFYYLSQKLHRDQKSWKDLIIPTEDAISLQIVSPADGATVVEYIQEIGVKVENLPQDFKVYSIVHPKDNSYFWIQTEVVEQEDGRWVSSIQLGENKEPSNFEYYVEAIATDAELSRDEMYSYDKKVPFNVYAVSNLITITR